MAHKANFLNEQELASLDQAADWLEEKECKFNFAVYRNEIARHARNLRFIAASCRENSTPPTKGENDGNHPKED